MNTLFDIVGECRYLSDKELIYNITNSEQAVQEYTNSLNHNETPSLDELFATLTPGRKKVATAAIEMYKRTKERKTNIAKMGSSADIYKLMHPILCDLPNEEFWIVLMNNANKLIKRIRLSVGGINSTCVDIRLLFKQVITNDAISFVVVHNHPSGNEKPSENDKHLTQRIQQVARSLDVSLVDHVIITDGKYYSFADEGII